MHFLLNVAPGPASAARRHIDVELERSAGAGSHKQCLESGGEG